MMLYLLYIYINFTCVCFTKFLAFYSFLKSYKSIIKYKNPNYGDEIPLCWCHQFDGGREWYTALGHQKEHYADPVFAQHLLGGILWAMGETNVKH